MVNKESSRTNHLNKQTYNYKLGSDKYQGIIIIEYLDGIKNIVWELDYILTNINLIKYDSFLRVQNWLKENHSELMI